MPPTPVLGPGIVDEVAGAVVRDFLDVDSMIHHFLSSLVQARRTEGTIVVVAVEVDVRGQVRVFGNLLMLGSMDWRQALLNLCMKLAKLNCTVYRISSNRHRGGYSGRSSCTPYSGLEIL